MSADPTPPAAKDGAPLVLTGDWDLSQLDALRAALAPLAEGGILDIGGAGRIDSAAAWLIARTAHARGATLDGVSSHDQRLFALVEDVSAAPPEPEPEPPSPRDRLEQIGRATSAFLRAQGELLGYLGLTLARIGEGIVRPARFRVTALVAQIDEAGFQAIPIVTLISFLIGIVIGYQGASQLTQFGADIFAVDLIAISVLRELGVLLTAIIVAGRSASAFTAAIGSMKMGEEIDAMKTIGIDPIQALIVPRVVALVISLPILVLIADVAGLIGGAGMSWLSLNISPVMFASRLVEEVSIKHAIVGLVKAPVFAVLIAVIGCVGGMRVKDEAAALGMATSASVVAAIFAVIAADALFSVFFAQMGW